MDLEKRVKMKDSSQKKILLVEDDVLQSSILKRFVEKNSDFVVDLEERGDMAVGRILEEKPDERVVAEALGKTSIV